MKPFIALLLAFISNAILLTAQNGKQVQDIPQLEEWWRAPENEDKIGRSVAYLPNFYHGKDAMAISTKNGMETWLNRFPGDRENVFSWKGIAPILTGDFNGDGITDYIDGAGNVYRGITNGEPPDSIPVRTGAFLPEAVADVNHDGYDDILWFDGFDRYTNMTNKVFYGAKDFNGMRRIDIPRVAPIDTSLATQHIYQGADGDIRYVFFFFGKVGSNGTYNGYALFRAHWEKGDTIPVFTKLAEVRREQSQFKNELTFDRGGALYKSKHHSNTFFLAKEYVGMTQKNIVIYNMNNDKFTQQTKFQFEGTYTFTALDHSIDTDNYEDWVIRCWGGASTALYFFSGKTMLDTIPLASYRPKCDNPPAMIQSIGDVNNDSVADVAIAINPFNMANCFMIVKGKSNPTNVVEIDIPTVQPVSIVPIPHPLSISLPIKLRLNVSVSATYSVEFAALDGSRIAREELGLLTNGTNDIVLSTVTFGSRSSQSVILRLKDGRDNVITERLIIIE